MVKGFDLNEFMGPSRDLSRSGSYQRGSYQMRSYQVAKLAVTAWIHSLARRWAGRGVTANLLDPGMVKSELGEHFEGPAPLGFLLSRLVPLFAAVDPQRGSEQYVRLATDAALATVSGRYFVSGQEKPDGSSPLSRDPAVQQRIEDAAEAWATPFLPAHVVSTTLAISSSTESAALAVAAATAKAL
jgi:NAD(P)-dependent dehydrogenase (short-subunit alcohol dehydrogenase family)